MTYRGTVKKGVIVLDGGITLDDGTAVEVQPLRVDDEPGRASPTIWDKLLTLRGTAPDLPADAARNHDQYLYGTPKHPAPDDKAPE